MALALAASAMLNIMALAFALLSDSISTKFFLAMVHIGTVYQCGLPNVNLTVYIY
jgi:hypothetical protein